MKYYTREDLEKIPIEEFSEELKANPAINFDDSLLTSFESEFALDTADIFRQGVCQLFARALQEEFGYAVYKIQVGHSFHIFCKSTDRLVYIDVRGKTSDFQEFIKGTDVICVNDDISEPYYFTEEDFDGDYYDIGLAFAKVLISRDIDRYKV